MSTYFLKSIFICSILYKKIHLKLKSFDDSSPRVWKPSDLTLLCPAKGIQRQALVAVCQNLLIYSTDCVLAEISLCWQSRDFAMLWNIWFGCNLSPGSGRSCDDIKLIGWQGGISADEVTGPSEECVARATEPRLESKPCGHRGSTYIAHGIQQFWGKQTDINTWARLSVADLGVSQSLDLKNPCHLAPPQNGQPTEPGSWVYTYVYIENTQHFSGDTKLIKSLADSVRVSGCVGPGQSIWTRLHSTAGYWHKLRIEIT